MKGKLTEHFGDIIVITNINGKADVVTFKSTASNILNRFYEAPKLRDSEAEKMKIVKVGADLTKHDIKCKQTSNIFVSHLRINLLWKRTVRLYESRCAYF
ncbi:hypothetical protein LSAT2_014604 [Lamellibrachia satsuma]|nr:hypothetical protein LSAT2_014604 [Lamellibrachia satsuma]